MRKPSALQPSTARASRLQITSFALHARKLTSTADPNTEQRTVKFNFNSPYFGVENLINEAYMCLSFFSHNGLCSNCFIGDFPGTRRIPKKMTLSSPTGVGADLSWHLNCLDLGAFCLVIARCFDPCTWALLMRAITCGCEKILCDNKHWSLYALHEAVSRTYWRTLYDRCWIPSTVGKLSCEHGATSPPVVLPCPNLVFIDASLIAHARLIRMPGFLLTSLTL